MQAYEISTEAVKAAPPATVAITTLAGVSLNDAVLVLTLIYVVLQVIVLCRKYIVDKKKNQIEIEKLEEELQLARMKMSRLEKRDEYKI